MIRRDYCEEKSCGNFSQSDIMHGRNSGSRRCGFGKYRRADGSRDSRLRMYSVMKRKRLYSSRRQKRIRQVVLTVQTVQKKHLLHRRTPQRHRML